MRTLYVGGLPPETDETALRELFEDFRVLGARVVCTRGRCRGFGYVTFARDDEAALAQRNLDGKAYGQLRLRVAAAT